MQKIIHNTNTFISYFFHRINITTHPSMSNEPLINDSIKLIMKNKNVEHIDKFKCTNFHDQCYKLAVNTEFICFITNDDVNTMRTNLGNAKFIIHLNTYLKNISSYPEIICIYNIVTDDQFTIDKTIQHLTNDKIHTLIIADSFKYLPTSISNNYDYIYLPNSTSGKRFQHALNVIRNKYANNKTIILLESCNLITPAYLHESIQKLTDNDIVINKHMKIFNTKHSNINHYQLSLVENKPIFNGMLIKRTYLNRTGWKLCNDQDNVSINIYYNINKTGIKIDYPVNNCIISFNNSMTYDKNSLFILSHLSEVTTHESAITKKYFDHSVNVKAREKQIVPTPLVAPTPPVQQNKQILMPQIKITTQSAKPNVRQNDPPSLIVKQPTIHPTTTTDNIISKPPNIQNKPTIEIIPINQMQASLTKSIYKPPNVPNKPSIEIITAKPIQPSTQTNTYRPPNSTSKPTIEIITTQSQSSPSTQTNVYKQPNMTNKPTIDVKTIANTPTQQTPNALRQQVPQPKIIAKKYEIVPNKVNKTFDSMVIVKHVNEHINAVINFKTNDIKYDIIGNTKNHYATVKQIRNLFVEKKYKKILVFYDLTEFNKDIVGNTNIIINSINKIPSSWDILIYCANNAPKSNSLYFKALTLEDITVFAVTAQSLDTLLALLSKNNKYNQSMCELQNKQTAYAMVTPMIRIKQTVIPEIAYIPEETNIVQGLWVGNTLSLMEITCIKSFINNGHVFHLYTYDYIDNVPSGCIIKDANEILPKTEIFYHTNNSAEKGSLGAFSDVFRFKLIYDKGGYWVDMDMICLRKFDFTTPYVFSSEHPNIVNSGIIKAPIRSEFAKFCNDTCKTKDRSKLKWGEIGPALVKTAIDKHKLHKYIHSPDTFCPVHFTNMQHITTDNTPINKTSYAIHLWNELWRRNNHNKNIPNDNSLYHHLVQTHEKPRIVVSCTQYPYYGGAATNCYSIIKYLRSKGYNTAGIFFENGNNNTDPDNISGIFRIKHQNNKPIYTKPILQSIIAYLNGYPTITLNKNFLAPLLIKDMFTNTYQIYLVAGIESFDWYYSKHPTDLTPGTKLAKTENLRYHIEEQVNNTCDLIVLNSYLCLQTFKTIYPESSHKILEYPIDTTSYVQKHNTPCSKEYDIILVCSNFNRHIKNNKFLIPILEKLPQYTKLFIGNNNECFNHIDNKTLLPLQSNNKVIEYMSKSKILLFPSLFDANPNTVREALNNNCLPLISNNVGFYELFPEYLVCNDFAEQTWTDKIVHILSSYENIEHPIISFNYKNLDHLLSYVSDACKPKQHNTELIPSTFNLSETYGKINKSCVLLYWLTSMDNNPTKTYHITVKHATHNSDVTTQFINEDAIIVIFKYFIEHGLIDNLHIVYLQNSKDTFMYGGPQMLTNGNYAKLSKHIHLWKLSSVNELYSFLHAKMYFYNGFGHYESLYKEFTKLCPRSIFLRYLATTFPLNNNTTIDDKWQDYTPDRSDCEGVYDIVYSDSAHQTPHYKKLFPKCVSIIPLTKISYLPYIPSVRTYDIIICASDSHPSKNYNVIYDMIEYYESTKQSISIIIISPTYTPTTKIHNYKLNHVNLTVKHQLSRDEVNRYFCQSKCNLITFGRDANPRAISESLYCGCYNIILDILTDGKDLIAKNLLFGKIIHCDTRIYVPEYKSVTCKITPAMCDQIYALTKQPHDHKHISDIYKQTNNMSVIGKQMLSTLKTTVMNKQRFIATCATANYAQSLNYLLSSIQSTNPNEHVIIHAINWPNSLYNNFTSAYPNNWFIKYDINDINPGNILKVKVELQKNLWHTHNIPYIWIDADSIVLKPLDPIFAKINDHDLVCYHRQNNPVHTKFAVGVIAFGLHTPVIIDNYYSHTISNAGFNNWFYDQIGLHETFIKHNPSLYSLTENEHSINGNTDTIIFSRRVENIQTIKEILKHRQIHVTHIDLCDISQKYD